MLCPNCGKEMKEKIMRGQEIDFSGTAEDWELEYYWTKYSCSSCRIIYNDTNWTIPKKYLPTEKQIKAMLFINNRLGTDFKAITKNQCWKIINKYFKQAQNTPSRHWWDNITDEDCDALGLDESMFY